MLHHSTIAGYLFMYCICVSNSDDINCMVCVQLAGRVRKSISYSLVRNVSQHIVGALYFTDISAMSIRH